MDATNIGQTALHLATQCTAAATKWSKLAARKRPLLLPVTQTLPVAGLEALEAQAVLYSIRQQLTTATEESATTEAWLQALQLAQVASDRLLLALWAVQRTLHFWRGRLRAGSHGSFMLLSRGPVRFVCDVLAALKLAGPSEGADVAASDRIEERILALQLLSREVSAALAAVHRAAALLKLTGVDASAAAAGPGQQAAVQQAVWGAVSACLTGMTSALQQLLPQVEQLQQQHTAARQLALSASSALAGPAVPSSSQQPAAAAAARPGLALLQLQQQLARVRQQLDVHNGDLTHSHRHGDAGSALSAASVLAAKLGPLVSVPHWALMPSALQRHWIRYGIAAGLGVSAGWCLYKHSRLAGSTDLGDWTASAVAAVTGAWGDHVVSPLLVVRDELFKTFRDRPSIVNSAEFEADKQSLLRMLDQFQQDHPAVRSSDSAAAAAAVAAAPVSSSSNSSNGLAAVGELLDSDAVNRGMAVVMRCYENDLKHPIRNLISGELARTLLIQVQRLKLDSEAAMLELDQILRANELSISLVAAVPALLLSWTLLRGLWLLLLAPRPPDPRREALPCRLAMAELERALAALAGIQQQQQTPETGSPAAAAAAGQQPARSAAAAGPSKGAKAAAAGAAAVAAASNAAAAATASSAAAAEGLVLYKLFQVYREAQRVYRLKDSTSKFSEWPHLQADLLELVHPGSSASDKLALHSRMLRTYTLLQP